MLWVLLNAAIAAPIFTGVDEAEASLMAAAWQQAVACTGVEPAHNETVEVNPLQGVGGFVGYASIRGGRLERVNLRGLAQWTERETLVHEVAHAWFYGGSPALREGFTQVLTHCIARALGENWRPGYPHNLTHMPDLRTWTNPDKADSAERSAGYRASARLAYAAVALLGLPAIVALDRPADWTRLQAAARTAGPKGELLLKAMNSDIEGQRHWLDDLDGDGLSRLEEEILGLDPALWDTDGDGWMDGQAPIEGAIPFPPHGQPLCFVPRSGTERSREGAQAGSFWPERTEPWVQLRAGTWGTRHGFLRGIERAPQEGALVVWQDDPPTDPPGGYWFRYPGAVHDPLRCAVQDNVVVEWVGTPGEVQAPLLAQLLAEQRTDFCPGERVLHVRLGAEDTSSYRGRINISAHLPEQLQQFNSEDQPVEQAIAALILGMELGGSIKPPSLVPGEALLADRTGIRLELPLFSLNESDTDRWLEAARACDRGWPALACGECPPPG